MKRLVCTVCSVLLCVGLLSGCGTSLEGEESVVYVGKKGVIESLDVESLDQSYYDETELKSYVDAEVKDYTAEHGKNAVEVESLKVEDGVAKLKMKNKTPEDYTAFNGIELYQGKSLLPWRQDTSTTGSSPAWRKARLWELPQNRIFTLRMI